MKRLLVLAVGLLLFGGGVAGAAPTCQKQLAVVKLENTRLRAQVSGLQGEIEVLQAQLAAEVAQELVLAEVANDANVRLGEALQRSDGLAIENENLKSSLGRAYDRIAELERALAECEAKLPPGP